MASCSVTAGVHVEARGPGVSAPDEGTGGARATQGAGDTGEPGHGGRDRDALVADTAGVGYVGRVDGGGHREAGSGGQPTAEL